MSRTTRIVSTPAHLADGVGTGTAGPRRRAGLSRRGALLSLTALPAAALLAACGGEEAPGASTDDPDAEGSGPGAEQPAETDDALTITDPWVKAAEDGMTSAFATITNNTDTELVLASVTTEASEVVELHQTAEDGSGGMSMEEKEGGFPILPGEELVLEPGGDHIMLMSLVAPLAPGDEVDMVLVFEDGTEHPLTATVKDFAGANENYDPEDDDAHGDHGDHEEHEEHEEEDH